MPSDGNKQLRLVLSFLRWFIRQVISEPIKVAKAVILVVVSVVFIGAMYSGVETGTNFGLLVFGAVLSTIMMFVMLELFVRQDRAPA